MSPKKLLRLPEARSSFDDMMEGIHAGHTIAIITITFSGFCNDYNYDY